MELELQTKRHCNVYLENVSFAVLQNEQDSLGIGRWTYLTILGKYNRRTTIFTMCRPCRGSISSMGEMVIKQQWLVMQQTKRKDHPHKAIIIDIIIVINKTVKEVHDIILSISGNGMFSNASGSIAKLYRECKLFDPFDHKYGNYSNTKSHLCGFQKIDFILCSFNILTTVIKCGMTGFNEITTSDHCRLFLDISRDIILKEKNSFHPTPLRTTTTTKVT